MSRPTKCRKVHKLPCVNEFVPVRCGECPSEKVCLTVDEFETIRLIDKEGFSQEECGDYMRVARTTVQQIYNRARKKIATAMVNGLAIKIEGGDYCLCDGEDENCPCKKQCCHKRCCKERIKEGGNNCDNSSTT